MKRLKADEKIESDSVNLLVTILISYPEIGTLHYEPEGETLKMRFIINQIINDKRYKSLKEEICRNTEVYYSLEKLIPEKFEIVMESYEQTTFISLVRDIATLSRGEIALICTLMGESFKGKLLTDGNMPVDEEEIGIQADFIDHMIKSVTTNPYVKRLIGIREEGRVLIFNK